MEGPSQPRIAEWPAVTMMTLMFVNIERDALDGTYGVVYVLDRQDLDGSAGKMQSPHWERAQQDPVLSLAHASTRMWRQRS